MKHLPQRILSIDALRAITMFLMIFVNDVAGVANIPQWIKHTEANEDGMGFSDIIFPAFLFIVGLSLTFAIGNRIKKGDSTKDLFLYILLRSSALIIMGFFHVNLENYNKTDALLPYPVYTILITISFFLIWLDYPEYLSKIKKYIFVSSGIVILLALAWLYKGGTSQNPEGLKPQWWGILGIIGWAYLITALVYILSKGKLITIIVAFLAFAAINVSTHVGLLNFRLPIIGDASSITLMLGGVLISSIYTSMIIKNKTQNFWIFLNIFGLVSIVFGSFIRPYANGISKIYATPAWVFICMGITVLVFELLVYLVDYKQKKNLVKAIKPAGTSTLTCYLIPYLLYSVFSLIHFRFPHFLSSGIGGITKSLIVAYIVVIIVSILEKKRLRLKV